MTLDRFDRNEARLAALAPISRKVRDTWSLGALLDVDGEQPTTFAADYAAGLENPKLALIGEGLSALTLDLGGAKITRLDAGQTLQGAKAAAVKKLLGRPELRSLQALDLRGARVQAAAAELSGCDELVSLGLGSTELVADGLARAYLPRLARLEVRGNKLDARDLLTLLTAPGLPRLDELDASTRAMTDDGFDALLGSGALARLRSLTLDTGPATQVSPGRWAAFAASPDVQGLRSLAIGRTGAPNDLEALLTSERLADLQELSVGLAGSLRRVELPSLASFAVTLTDPDAITALITSPPPPNLRALDLTVGWYELSALPALYRSAWCAGLTSLTVRCHGFRTPEDAAAALDLPAIPGLRALSLRCAAPTAPFAKLLAGLAPGTLTALRVDALEAGGALAVAESAALDGLKELHLTAGRVGQDELAAVVTSPRAAALQGLGWGCGAVGPAGVRALLDGVTCAKLVALHLQTTADVDDALKARLFENPRTPKLWTLTGCLFPAPKSVRGAVRANAAPARD